MAQRNKVKLKKDKTIEQKTKTKNSTKNDLLISLHHFIQIWSLLAKTQDKNASKQNTNTEAFMLRMKS